MCEPTVNIVLRAATLVSRLMLIVGLAHLLPPAELGLYGLLLVTIGYTVLAVGLDFYTYSQREILGSPTSERGAMLVHHGGVCSVAYLVVVPISMVAFVMGYLPWWTAPWFVALLIAEHAAQEMNRLLIAVQRQVIASTVLFLRQGAWTWIALASLFYVPGAEGLLPILTCWLAGCLSALALGAWCLRDEIARPRTFRWDWAWAMRGVRTGLLFLGASLSLRGILTFDRYLLDAYAGPHLVGVYTLYAGIALAVMNFMEAAVFVFRYPPMVRAWQEGRYATYHAEWRRLLRDTVLTLIMLAAAAAVAGLLVASLIGRPIYLENISIFGWLLTGVCLQALGMIPHYGLYAMRFDRPILVAHVSGLFVFVALAQLLSPKWPTVAVPAAVCGAFAWLFAVKAFAYCRLRDRGLLASAVT